MAYISNEERNKRINASNQSYALRKAFIAVTVGLLALLVSFAIVSVVMTYNTISDDQVTMNLLNIVKKYLNGQW
ncbi:MAG: hypothetical protein MJ223_00680 [Mycoplasmoidaceae bacterium]|nr:hypothetical protein [Mycoplasmoidaceae bacterium]